MTGELRGGPKGHAAEDDAVTAILDLRAARLRQGLTLEAVAKQMRVTKQRVSQLEQGRQCSIDTLARWAIAVGMKLEVTR